MSGIGNIIKANSMKSIRFYTMLAAAMLASSCVKENTPENSSSAGDPIKTSFVATGEIMTKTSLDASYNVLWTKDNTVSVFPGGVTDIKAAQFTTQDEGTTEASFEGTVNTGNGSFYAIYPHHQEAVINSETVSGITLPALQRAVTGSFDNDINIMMAKSEGDRLIFKNVCGLIRVPVTRNDLTSITLTTNSGSPLAGTFDLQWNAGEPKAVNITNASDHITLSGNGEILKPGNYFFTVLPGMMKGGFSLSYTSAIATNAEQTATSDVDVKRSHILYIGEPDKKAEFNHRVLDNFEDRGQLTWHAGDGAVFEPAANPSRSGINTTATVSKYITSANAWDFVEASFTKLDLNLGQLIKMHVFSPAAGIRIYAKLTSSTGVNKEVKTAITSVANSWEEMCFNFESLELGNLEYVKLTICADAGGTADGTEIYFDNITQCSHTHPFVDPASTRQIGDFEGFGILGVHGMSGVTWTEVENPDKTGINPSDKVGCYTKTSNAWDGVYTDTFDAFDFANDGAVIKMHVYAPDAGQTIQLKLEAGSESTYRSMYVNALTTTANQWEELTFDFGSAMMNNASNTSTLSDTFNKFVIYAYGGNSGAGGKHILFDNIRQTKPENAFYDLAATRCFGGFEYSGLLKVNNSNVSSWSIVPNPVAGGLNPSSHCGCYEKSANSWDLVYTDPFTDLNFARDGYKMKMQVYAPHTGMTFQIKLEGNNGSYINYRVNVTNTKANEWEELTFDFQKYGVSESNPKGTLDDKYWKFCICAYGGAGGYQGTKIYIDNIRQVK